MDHVESAHYFVRSLYVTIVGCPVDTYLEIETKYQTLDFHIENQ